MANFTNAETAFNNTLSELYDAVDIMGYKFDVGPALFELDRIAYREAFLDWLDAERERVQDDYPDLDQGLVDIEGFYTEDGDFDITDYVEAIEEAAEDE